MQLPDEPLALSAPLARQFAATLCEGSGGRSCAWNHGLWQYLRIMDLATGPAHRAAFYREAFSKINGLLTSPRILISGTADYSMFAHVLAAFRSRGMEPAVTVIDVCETPLALNRWYAEQVASSVETHRCDIFRFNRERAFDAVCTDNFLAQIRPSERAALMVHWYQLLVPGGVVITVNRLRPDSDGKQVVFTEEQVDAFVARVRAAAVSMSNKLQMDAEELAGAAQSYARLMGTWPVRTQDEVVGLFEQGGFRVECSVASNVLDRLPDSPTGPTVPGNALYAQVIATRP